MRQIGSLADEQQARLVADYLLTQGMVAHNEQEGREWTIWVREENQVESAKQILEEFRRDPQNAKFREAVSEAQKIRAADARRRAQAARKTVDVRNTWNRPISRRAPLTISLIGLSVFVWLLTSMEGTQSGLSETLMTVDKRVYEKTHDPFSQIKQGQIWRLVTPVFLHGGFLHLAFNMMWMVSLATQVEMRRGTVRFGWLVLCLALASNLTQLLSTGPYFLGMSGVVYGIFGYMWVKRLARIPNDYVMPDLTVAIMLVFLVLGFVGSLNSMFGGGTTANGAHLGGLLAGMAIGYLPALRGK